MKTIQLSLFPDQVKTEIISALLNPVDAAIKWVEILKRALENLPSEEDTMNSIEPLIQVSTSKNSNSDQI